MDKLTKQSPQQHALNNVRKHSVNGNPMMFNGGNMQATSTTTQPSVEGTTVSDAALYAAQQ